MLRIRSLCSMSSAFQKCIDHVSTCILPLQSCSTCLFASETTSGRRHWLTAFSHGFGCPFVVLELSLVSSWFSFDLFCDNIYFITLYLRFKENSVLKRRGGKRSSDSNRCFFKNIFSRYTPRKNNKNATVFFFFNFDFIFV